MTATVKTPLNIGKIKASLETSKKAYQTRLMARIKSIATSNTSMAALLYREQEQLTIFNELSSIVERYALITNAYSKKLNHESSKLWAEVPDSDKSIELLAVEQDRCIIELADIITKLEKVSGIEFTNPNQDYYFWSTQEGKFQAYHDGGWLTHHANLPGKPLAERANVIAPASAELFSLLFGAVEFKGNSTNISDIKLQSKQDPESKVSHELTQVLFPALTQHPDKEVDCQSLLWASMSKVFAEKAVAAAKARIAQGKKPPVFRLYLPELMTADNNFLSWELPYLRQLQKTAPKIKIEYFRKSQKNKTQWEPCQLDDYLIQAKYDVKGKKLTVKRLREMCQKWKRHANDKNRERELDVNLRVIAGVSSEKSALESYQKAGALQRKEAKFIEEKVKEWDKIWKSHPHYHQRTAALKQYINQTLYNANTVVPNEVSLKDEVLELSDNAKLLLMQKAKQYLQFQLLIDLNKPAPKSSHALGYVIYARNRIALETLINLSWLLSNTEIEDREQKIKDAYNKYCKVAVKHSDKELTYLKKNKSPVVFLEEGMAIKNEVDLLKISNDYPELEKIVQAPSLITEVPQITFQDCLDKFKEGLFEHFDVACGGKYLEFLSNKYYQSHAAVSQELLKQGIDVAMRTYDTAIMNGLDECVSPPVLRCALLAALTLGDSNKIEAVVARMSELDLNINELTYLTGLNFYQLENAKEGKPISYKAQRLIDHPVFNKLKILMSQKASTTVDNNTDLSKQLWNSTYDYRQAISSYSSAQQRSGNIKFGYTLADQVVTNGDIQVFQKLVNDTPIGQLIPTEEELQVLIDLYQGRNESAALYFSNQKKYFYHDNKNLLNLKLSEIEDVDTALSLMSNIVTMNYQAIHDSADFKRVGFRKLDYFINAVNKLLCAKDDVRASEHDTGTSLSIMYGMQIGDCRHHGESMQLFFDVWKNDQMKAALQDNDKSRFDELADKQLRVVDTQGQTADGNFSYGHTYNLLFNKKENNITAYDPFHYSQKPQIVKLKKVNEDLRFEPIDVYTPEVNETGTETKMKPMTYKVAPWSGHKGNGDEKVGTALLGRTGITSDSIYGSIVDRDKRTRTREIVKECFQKEIERSQYESSLKDLYERIVIRGYVNEQVLLASDPKIELAKDDLDLLSTYLMGIDMWQKAPQQSEFAKDIPFKPDVEILKRRNNFFQEVGNIKSQAARKELENIKKDYNERPLSKAEKKLHKALNDKHWDYTTKRTVLDAIVKKISLLQQEGDSSEIIDMCQQLNSLKQRLEVTTDGQKMVIYNKDIRALNFYRGTFSPCRFFYNNFVKNSQYMWLSTMTTTFKEIYKAVDESSNNPEQSVDVPVF